MRGTKDIIAGTPLSMIFRTDPSRVEFYKHYHILTTEQLAAMNATDSANLGMGVKDDVEKAKLYNRKIKEQAPALELNARLEAKDKQIASLTAQLADYGDKLNQLLDSQINGTPLVKKKGGRPAANKANIEE